MASTSLTTLFSSTLTPFLITRPYSNSHAFPTSLPTTTTHLYSSTHNHHGHPCKAASSSSSSSEFSISTEFDLYDLLGIENSSDQTEIKMAYRSLQKKCHPDIAGPAGHDMAIILNQVYALLSDPVSRSAYDKEQAKTAELRGYTGKPLYSVWQGPETEQRAVFVDEVKCAGCLKCALLADKTFAIESVYGRARVVAQWADPEHKIQESIDACPVNCISMVERSDLAALEFIMSKQPRGNVRIGASNTGGKRVFDVFSELKVFHKRLQEAMNRKSYRDSKKMATNITKREFEILDVSGENYLKWKVDAYAHLKASALEKTVENGNDATAQEKSKANCFLRHHIHEDLKMEYITVDDPSELWQSLQERFGHERDILLPQAIHEWANLRFQDFRSVREYNSAMFRITSQLKLCGYQISENDMLEKTFSTMHASNMLLQQQYRERRFKKYSELISVLLMAEKNNELLLKNHNTRPAGSSALPDANATQKRRPRHLTKHNKSRGNAPQAKGKYFKGKGKQRYHMKREIPEKRKALCFKCGIKGHFAKDCRTAKHLVEAYQAMLKNKDNNVEANLVENDLPAIPSLDVSDYFTETDNVGNDFV